MGDASGIAQFADKPFDHTGICSHVGIEEFQDELFTDHGIFHEHDGAKAPLANLADDAIAIGQRDTCLRHGRHCDARTRAT